MEYSRWVLLWALKPAGISLLKFINNRIWTLIRNFLGHYYPTSTPHGIILPPPYIRIVYRIYFNKFHIPANSIWVESSLALLVKCRYMMQSHFNQPYIYMKRLYIQTFLNGRYLIEHIPPLIIGLSPSLIIIIIQFKHIWSQAIPSLLAFNRCIIFNMDLPPLSFTTDKFNTWIPALCNYILYYYIG